MGPQKATTIAVYGPNKGHELERYAHVELDDARIARRGEAPKIGIGDVAVDAREAGVVKGVEHISADLQTDRLSKLQVLRQRQIDIPEPGQAKGTSTECTGTSRSSTRRYDRDRSECCPVQIHQRIVRVINVGFATDIVDALIAEGLRHVCVKWRSSFGDEDTTDLPTL